MPGQTLTDTPVERFELAPGYTISRLIKGGWHLAGGHGPVDREQAIADMARFVEAGVTTFDCADHYTGVEALIGDFLAAHPSLASQVQVQTKFVPDYDRLQSCDRDYVTGIIDRSLARLRVDCLDLVQFHWWNTAVPGWIETMGLLDDLRRAGKIRHLGLTNFNTDCTRRILAAGIPLAATQVQYSLIDARPEKGLVELCGEHGVSLLCYGSLAGGFFADRWLGQPEPLEPLENRSQTKYKLIIEDFGGWPPFQRMLETMDDIARKHRVSIPQVATRWVLDRPAVGAAIVGATSARHLGDNLKVFGFALDDEDRVLLETVRAERRGPDGDVYDVERDKTGRHGRIMRYNQNDGRV